MGRREGCWTGSLESGDSCALASLLDLLLPQKRGRQGGGGWSGGKPLIMTFSPPPSKQGEGWCLQSALLLPPLTPDAREKARFGGGGGVTGLVQGDDRIDPFLKEEISYHHEG
jgi:hypothetical protein